MDPRGRNLGVLDRPWIETFDKVPHLTPDLTLSSVMVAQGPPGAYTFALACEDEYIPPHQPDRLPVLFSVDRKLRVPNGQRWEVSCDGQVADKTCVWHQLVPLIPKRLPKVLSLNAASHIVEPHRT